MKMRDLSLFACIAALSVAACNAPAQKEAVASTKSAAPTVTVPNNGLIPGTPAGDEGDWITEIRSGIKTLPQLVKSDAAGAQKKALELYVTRQEYSEMYYGVNGRNKVSVEMGAQIATAEQRFHDLLKILSSKTPSADDVTSAVAKLDKEQKKVLEMWTASGAHITR